MNIKVEKVNRLRELFEVIDSCSTNVQLVTGEGDCLNMKSKLSQYLSMTRMFAEGEIPQMEFVVNDEHDADKIKKFLEEDKSYMKL